MLRPSLDNIEVWEAHTAAEFKQKSADAAIATMTDHPVLIHVPVGTGASGKEPLRAFYRDIFIPQMPPDIALELLTRTIAQNFSRQRLREGFSQLSDLRIGRNGRIPIRHRASRYGALHATMASGRVRLATDGHHSPSADESRKEPLTANLDADQIALPQSVIVAIFVREQALRSIQIHRLQINGCSLLRAIIQNPIVHLEPVYSVLVECLGATSAKHKHDEGD